jgi:hypothetical protein
MDLWERQLRNNNQNRKRAIERWFANHLNERPDDDDRHPWICGECGRPKSRPVKHFIQPDEFDNPGEGF